MEKGMDNKKLDQLIIKLSRLWKGSQDRDAVAKTIRALDIRYDLGRKIVTEAGVAVIIDQMLGRLANSYERLSTVQRKRILDIACGSNSSRLPASLFVNTPFGEVAIGRKSKEYTALFEPWFCRILLELGADPVGVDFGDLDQELFIHYRVDLGKAGALDFLPGHSFDGIQDSRLFGSPEFTEQFPDPAGRLKVAREIVGQEQRLLKDAGIIIHSDAMELFSGRL
jgi:hypothetical protein